MTGEEIYNLFKDLVDQEEFADDTSALRAMNVAYRKVLAERDWEFLKKSSAQALGFSDLTLITDYDKLLRAWSVVGTNYGDKQELLRAIWDERFDLSKDYFIDNASKTFNLIGDAPSRWLSYVFDYKYRPADLDMNTEPVFPLEFHPIIAYEMVKAFKESDQSTDFYTETSRKSSELLALMVAWNENLKN